MKMMKISNIQGKDNVKVVLTNPFNCEKSCECETTVKYRELTHAECQTMAHSIVRFGVYKENGRQYVQRTAHVQNCLRSTCGIGGERVASKGGNNGEGDGR